MIIARLEKKVPSHCACMLPLETVFANASVVSIRDGSLIRSRFDCRVIDLYMYILSETTAK